MFSNKSKLKNETKKAIYLSLGVITGILLSFILHGLIEISYLFWAEKQSLAVSFYGGCALPPILNSGLVFAGAVGGFLAGVSLWRKR